MTTVDITPDTHILFDLGFVKLNATLVFSWLVMAICVVGSWLVTRRITSDVMISRGQNLFEVIVRGIREQIRDITQQDPDQYLPFVGTLFLYIAVSNILTIVPFYEPPTGSLTTTAALALCVAVAVPYFGISKQGLSGYLKQYLQPSPLMLPFNIIGEFSRTLALMVRLFGNIMSGSMIAMILLLIAPLFLPAVMQVLGLLTGLVQAYIFAVLAMVYIASATRVHSQKQRQVPEVQGDD
jgi:F-type H+-transporting ATPase subunit a